MKKKKKKENKRMKPYNLQFARLKSEIKKWQ